MGQTGAIIIRMMMNRITVKEKIGLQCHGLIQQQK